MEKLFFAGAVPSWAIVIISLALFALLFYQFRGCRERLSPLQSWVLVSLRGLVYAALIFFLLSPGWVEERVTKLRRPLMLLLDASQSMAFPSDPASTGEGQGRKKSRIDLVKEKLLEKLPEDKETLIERLARDYDLQLFQFGTSLEPTTPGTLSRLTARDRGTRLLESLREAEQKAGASAAILLFSDGIANGKTTVLGPSASFSVPIFTVGVGESQGYMDLSIGDLSVPEFAFRGREIKVDLIIQAHGLAGKKIPLYFNRGSRLISSRTLSIDGDPFEQKVTLAYTPKEIGPHSFTLSLPPQVGEQITQNNQRAFKIDILRDKIRILTLSGSPSWNYRFLRMALKQDPFIELVSFVFLRTPTDSVDVPEDRLSLIPFPIDEIFLEELKNFDLLIFDNFSHRSYFNVLYLEKTKDFIREGGGFAMFGGSRSFDNGGYQESPLREVLPVELDGKDGYRTGLSVRGTLTGPGRAHPITRLLPDPRANEELWKKLPALTSLNRVPRSKGETLLTAAPDGAGGGSPLLTVGRFGKGRTLALMSDDFWRWNFIAVGKNESPQNHLKLIRQAVRWLAQEPSFEQVKIRPVGGSRGPGEKMDIQVQVLKDDFTPAADATLTLRVIGPDGEQIPLEAIPETEEGEYGAVFTPTKEGSYRLEAEAHLAGKTLGRDRRSFVVAFPHGETEDGRPRFDLLRKIAETARGEFIPISEWNEKSMERIQGKLDSLAPSEIIERRQIPLWSILWTFLVLLILLSSEWWLRRRWGMV
jgi:uncharacterized membrane protein